MGTGRTGQSRAASRERFSVPGTTGETGVSSGIAPCKYYRWRMQREGYRNRRNRFAGAARASGICALALALWFDGAGVAGPIAPAELYAALSSAQGGERIELAGGDYGSLDIRGVTFPSDVTIVSADPENPAVIRGVYLRDSSHLVFDGILFDYVAEPGDAPWVKPFIVRDSTFITIRNSVFDGAEVPSATGIGEYGTGFGLRVQGSDNITVENNEFFEFYKAFVALLSSNITVNANDVHTISGDIFNFVSVDGLLVEGNWLHDFKIDPTSGNHPDMIQLWTSPGEEPVQNVIIRGNFLDAGTGNWTQSIFMANPGEPFLNILIEDNVIYNDHLHGITVGLTDGLVIRNNTLLHDPSTISPLGWPPRIILAESSLNVTVESNITADVWNWDAMTGQPGWTVGNNLLVQYDGPGRRNYYLKLFTNALGQDSDLADLRALPGGLIETLGLGAEMTRTDIDITLDVGPAR